MLLYENYKRTGRVSRTRCRRYPAIVESGQCREVPDYDEATRLTTDFASDRKAAPLIIWPPLGSSERVRASPEKAV